MKKLKELGKVLGKQEQKKIIGGYEGGCMMCLCADGRTAFISGYSSNDVKAICASFCSPVPVVGTNPSGGC